jgi:hypothetical protein
MMRTMALLLCALLPAFEGLFAQPGKNCFNTQFHRNASDRDPVNAYLLAYLTTMIYPDYLRYMYSPVPPKDGSFVKGLQSNDAQFESEYAARLSYLFSDAVLTVPLNTAVKVNPSLTGTVMKLATTTGAQSEPPVVFDFQRRCNSSGYDPEAMIISTPTTIFVIFRGTDRVSCNQPGSFGYEWGEWLASDFKFLKRDASVIHPGVRGQVHRGMVESLLFSHFADSLASRVVNRYHGAAKKVWITGHSLGGGHAQLFAMFLKYNYNVTAQGIYLYESPHPGDQTFVNQLNADFGRSRIQRFEFSDDPIPTLPPQAFLFGRAGVRIFFKDISSPALNGVEQIPVIDDAKIFCAIGNLPAEETPPSSVKFEFVAGCGGVLCFHHPTWVLQACRHQIASSLYASLPPEVPLPASGDNCTSFDIAQGRLNDVVDNTASAIESAVNDILWNVGQLTDNILDKAVPEGNYELISYAFRNAPLSALEWPTNDRKAGTPESKVRVWNGATKANSTFHIEHDLLGGGYRVSILSGKKDVLGHPVRYYMEIPLAGNDKNGTLVQMQENHPFDGQIWLFYKISKSIYVLYNKLSHKVLDANAGCQNPPNDCRVHQQDAGHNVQTQLWMLRSMK